MLLVIFALYLEQMNPNLTSGQIGKRLAALRKKKGYSQKDLAEVLKVPRTAIAQAEAGNRSLTALELIEISKFLNISLDMFLSYSYNVSILESSDPEVISESDTDNVRISIPSLSLPKAKNVLLYILERCAGKPNVGETVLNKLLYLCDINYYELYEEHLSGVQYKKLPYGPVPMEMDTLMMQMINEEILIRIKVDYFGLKQTRFIPLVSSDLKYLNAREKQVIDQVIERYSDWSATALSEYSHNDIPWKATDDGGLIDYELAFYRKAPYSVRTYQFNSEQP
jgi:transcriptional regulator with XRE-family HTH domain/uncharacterized phage-associated protein